MFAKLAAPNFWGLLVRLAFHDAGTHSGLPNATARFQGANGSIRFELGWDSNAGVFAVWPTVEAAAKVLEAKYGPDAFSYADLIALAGAAAVRRPALPTQARQPPRPHRPCTTAYSPLAAAAAL